MTSTTLYAVTVPILDAALSNLAHVLKKGQENAAERGIDEQVFLNARLAPDMFPLVRQVQIAASLAKACPFRLAGEAPPIYEDTEASFADLYDLIEKARADITGFSAAQIDGQENRTVTIKTGGEPREILAGPYAIGFIMPNVYFHATTVYNILRQNGVPLGKKDFFGGAI